MRIVIFGAGVAGLAAAHLLAPHAEVHVYEQRDRAGGLARSEGPPCDTREISWRVYFHFYKHLFALLQDIPSYDGRTVYQHLIPYYNKTLPGIAPSSLPFWQLARLQLFSSERLAAYDGVAWHDYVGSDFAQIPQWLGLDRFRASTNSVQRIGIEQAQIAGQGLQDWVLDGPTNDVWIDPWVAELRRRGVQIHFEMPLTRLELQDKHVTRAWLPSGPVQADVFVLALPIEALAALATPLVPQARQLAALCWQVQLAFQLHLAQPLSLGPGPDGNPILSFILYKSPWSLIVEAKDISWAGGSSSSAYCRTAQWSATVCQANVPGRLGKTLLESTQHEAEQEILAQLEGDKSLMDYLRKHNPTFDGQLRVVRWATMDKTYHLGSEPVTSEPKFSNNAGSLKLRPHTRLGDNVLLATAYNAEAIDIFSMEAAAMGAHAAVAELLGTPKPMMPPRPLAVLAPLRAIDQVLFAAGLPDVLVTMVILVSLLIVVAALRFSLATA